VTDGGDTLRASLTRPATGLLLVACAALPWAGSACASDPDTEVPRSATVSATAGQAATLVCPAETEAEPGSTALQAQLRSAAGRPLSGRELAWSSSQGGLEQERTRTDASGTARNGYIVPFDLGARWEDTVIVRFAGDSADGPAECRVSVHAISPGLPPPPSATRTP
jgi:hypothetical protein